MRRVRNPALLTDGDCVLLIDIRNEGWLAGAKTSCTATGGEMVDMRASGSVTVASGELRNPKSRSCEAGTQVAAPGMGG